MNESAAQFAKEAMACQSLDNDEILNVRWATEDPNPQQKTAERERLLRELEQRHWNATATAAALGISRNTLYRKLRKHGIRVGFGAAANA